MLGIAFDRDDINRLRLMRVHLDGKTEIRWEITTYFVPHLTRIIGAHHVPMFLHEENARSRSVHGNPMDTMADVRLRVGDFVGGLKTAINRPPCLAGIIGPK